MKNNLFLRTYFLAILIFFTTSCKKSDNQKLEKRGIEVGAANFVTPIASFDFLPSSTTN